MVAKVVKKQLHCMLKLYLQTFLALNAMKVIERRQPGDNQLFRNSIRNVVPIFISDDRT